MVTIVGAPIGVAMLNKLPQVIALRGHRTSIQVTYDGASAIAKSSPVPQRNILLRAIYFVLIGWWLSALWMEVTYALCLSIIGLPIGIWALVVLTSREVKATFPSKKKKQVGKTRRRPGMRLESRSKIISR